MVARTKERLGRVIQCPRGHGARNPSASGAGNADCQHRTRKRRGPSRPCPKLRQETNPDRCPAGFDLRRNFRTSSPPSWRRRHFISSVPLLLRQAQVAGHHLKCRAKKSTPVSGQAEKRADFVAQGRTCATNRRPECLALHTWDAFRRNESRDCPIPRKCAPHSVDFVEAPPPEGF
jgi:hypothetical protein